MKNKENKVRNIAIFIILVFIFSVCLVSLRFVLRKSEVKAEDVSGKLIRFHVLANSDSEADQNLKIKVKNDVVEYMYNKLEGSQSLEESRKIIESELANIKDIASKRIEEEGFEYSVKTELDNEVFPEKRYGDVVLPPGEYEAVRVLIGEAQGQNWWCVMFPPLCFVDVTLEEFSVEDTQEMLERYISEDDADKIIDKDANVKFKFKLFEMFK